MKLNKEMKFTREQTRRLIILNLFMIAVLCFVSVLAIIVVVNSN